MAHIRFSYDHSHTKDHAKLIVSEISDRLAEQYRVRTSWREDTLLVQGRGISSTITVHENRVDVDARLSLTMRPLKGTLSRELRSLLKEHLG